MDKQYKDVAFNAAFNSGDRELLALRTYTEAINKAMLLIVRKASKIFEDFFAAFLILV